MRCKKTNLKKVKLMKKYRLRKLLIKPTFACNASCKNCIYRRELYNKLRKEDLLTFDDWKRILKEAYQLGVKLFIISGGEPTLYPRLPELIEIGRSYGWIVKLNSNGSMITPEYAETLIRAGLNFITISLYAPHQEINTQMRGTNQLWMKTTSAIKIFSQLEKRYPYFKVNTQSILVRENFDSFAELLELHYQLGSNRMTVSYLEGDFEKKNLLTEEEISYFKKKIIPKAIDFCQTLDKDVRTVAIRNLKGLFSEENVSLSDWAKGVYQPKNSHIRSCQIAQELAFILANGDVHPCHIVEYTHEPLMGNLFKNTLTELWYSNRWMNFRENLFDRCELCPINLHTTIPLRFDKSKRLRNFYEAKIKDRKIFQILKPLVQTYKKLWN